MGKRGKKARLIAKKKPNRKPSDRLSQLPDSLICQILSHLPTKQAVKTSVLSTRWKTLWLWLPHLELRSLDFNLDFNAFISFGDWFFHSERVSCIEKVEFYITEQPYSDRDTSYLKSWIDAAVKRKIRYLYVGCSFFTSYELPLSLYKCDTLVSLKLFVVGVTLDHTQSVSLPCLKTLHFQGSRFCNEATFERLVSSCPVLEKLKIYAYPMFTPTKVYRVLSMSLKKLLIRMVEDDRTVGSEFVIDAPRVSFLGINDNYSDSFMVKNMEPSAQVDISLTFGLVDYDEASVLSKSTSLRSFLSGISKVSDMTLYRDTFKLICRYSKSEPLPQFGYMSRLRVTVRVSDLICLPTFLESCANLKSLILVWNGNSKKRYNDDYDNPIIIFFSVPECLLSSLEFVDIKTSISGYPPEMKVVRYFLENSAILKNLTLRLNYYSVCEKSFFKELRKIPRRSATCEVVVL